MAAAGRVRPRCSVIAGVWTCIVFVSRITRRTTVQQPFQRYRWSGSPAHGQCSLEQDPNRHAACSARLFPALSTSCGLRKCAPARRSPAGSAGCSPSITGTRGDCRLIRRVWPMSSDARMLFSTARRARSRRQRRIEPAPLSSPRLRPGQAQRGEERSAVRDQALPRPANRRSGCWRTCGSCAVAALAIVSTA